MVSKTTVSSSYNIPLPITIFNSQLTVLESVVKYLYERQGLTLADISRVLHRDQRNIWHIYDQARKKYPKQFEATKSETLVPLSVFSKPKLSALEALVLHLKDAKLMSFQRIAELIQRSPSTIRTVYLRAKLKKVSVKPVTFEFPIEILNKNLTVLESVVKYLHEEKGLTFKQISHVLYRDQRNIWRIYAATRKKVPGKVSVSGSKLMIPISIFARTKLSAGEALVAYLVDKRGKSYREIADLVVRDARTIWTIYHRARKKYER